MLGAFEYGFDHLLVRSASADVAAQVFLDFLLGRVRIHLQQMVCGQHE
jgi:hypothetical protein